MKTVINQKILFGDYLEIYFESFLKACKSENKTRGTVDFYRKKPKVFVEFCDSQEVKLISILRDYLPISEDKGHNPGGVSTFYRTVKTFCVGTGGLVSAPAIQFG